MHVFCNVVTGMRLHSRRCEASFLFVKSRAPQEVPRLGSFPAPAFLAVPEPMRWKTACAYKMKKSPENVAFSGDCSLSKNYPICHCEAPKGAVAISQNVSELSENSGESETFYMRFPRRFAHRNDITESSLTRSNPPKTLRFRGIGDPLEIRTPDPLLKRQLLCLLS